MYIYLCRPTPRYLSTYRSVCLPRILPQLYVYVYMYIYLCRPTLRYLSTYRSIYIYRHRHRHIHKNNYIHKQMYSRTWTRTHMKYISRAFSHPHTHTHSHIHIYIYKFVFPSHLKCSPCFVIKTMSQRSTWCAFAHDTHPLHTHTHPLHTHTPGEVQGFYWKVHWVR